MARNGGELELRQLDITDLKRIERFRRAGFGGSVSDTLNGLGVQDTVFANSFKPLRQGMQLVGRALPIKLHSQVGGVNTPDEQRLQEKKWEAEGGHPQKRMMRTVQEMEDDTVLCFDCGGDMQPAQRLWRLDDHRGQPAHLPARPHDPLRPGAAGRLHPWRQRRGWGWRGRSLRGAWLHRACLMARPESGPGGDTAGKICRILQEGEWTVASATSGP